LRQKIAALVRRVFGASSERINAVFRAAHTIKGSAGLFSLDLIVQFTHVMESVLVRVRNDELPIDPPMCALMFACGDYIGQLIDALEAGGELSDPDPATRGSLLADLAGRLGSTAAAPAAAGQITPQEVSAAGWRIAVQPAPDLLRQGMDPLPFLLYLARYGEIERIATSAEQLPALTDLDPETCYLAFEVVLRGAVSRETVLQTFEFIADDCQIELSPLEAAAARPGEPEATPGSRAKTRSGEGRAHGVRPARVVEAGLFPPARRRAVGCGEPKANPSLPPRQIAGVRYAHRQPTGR